MNRYLIFLLLIYWVGISNISFANEIKIKTFSNYYEATNDKNLEICWEFENAKNVLIQGLGIDQHLFKPKGCFGLIPDKNLALKFIVFSEDDTLELTSVVVLKNNEDENLKIGNQTIEYEISETDNYEIEDNEIRKNDVKKEFLKSKEEDSIQIPQRGPIRFKRKNLDVSFEKSEYFFGSFQATKLTEPCKMKIVSSNFNISNEEIEIDAIILDEYGNYLKGLSQIESHNWDLRLQNQALDKNYHNIFVEEINKNIPDNISILLDNSIAQFNREQLLSLILEFLNYQDEFDNVSFSIFNQSYQNIFNFSPMDKALWLLGNIKLEPCNSLNSLYKSLFIQLDQIHKSNPVNPYLVVLTFNSDNSSLIYTANDVINLSNKYGIPIYIIGIGNAIDTYSLRYITMATGGKFYHIMDDEFPDILKALLEISHSKENHYRFKIKVDNLNQMDAFIAKLDFKTTKKFLSDYTKIIFNPNLNFIPYQILANFDSGSSEIREQFFEVLDALVFVMKNNPEKKIQLIGHSDREGDEKENIKLSKSRVQAVKDYLVKKGVNVENISTKAEGFHKPLFFNTFKDWQKLYNRRVEIKWLDPSVKPYEVVLQDLFDNEYKASTIIEKIEKSGFNSYYERYIFENDIYYQIRLWGYASIPEAKTEAYKFLKIFPYKVYVE